MKHNIPRNKNRTRFKIKHLITLHIKRILKENTPPGSRRKLRSSLGNSRSKILTTKNFEMIITRRLFKKKLIRSFIIQ